MYISGAVIPVPEGNKDRYGKLAEKFWAILSDYGALEQTEGWEADVPDGKQTDFRRAVAAEPGEKIVLSCIIWPDRETCESAHAKMADDPRMHEIHEDMPFEGKRMILGNFSPLFVGGR